MPTICSGLTTSLGNKIADVIYVTARSTVALTIIERLLQPEGNNMFFLSYNVGFVLVQADTLEECASFQTSLESSSLAVLTHYIISIPPKEAITSKQGFGNNAIYLLILGFSRHINSVSFLATSNELKKLCK